MIVREVLRNPELARTMDLFNDSRDTLWWLRNNPPSLERDVAIEAVKSAIFHTKRLS